MLNTPILFLIFNRPDLTELVFATIKKAQPKQLFIAADGARQNKEGEDLLCQETRAIVLNNIDWDCEVVTLLRDKNLGCKIAVSQAITWFFEHVEAGIILEDDCLADPSFFTFCEEILIRYRNDNRITQVCGINYMDAFNSNNESYLFSKIGSIWGWATWRRAWKEYDVNIITWGKNKNKKEIKRFLENEEWFNKVKGGFNLVYKRRYDTWDFQWFYTQLYSKGMSIVPNVNLVENLGFRGDATHTISKNDFLMFLKKHSLNFPLSHPLVFSHNLYYENYSFGLLPMNKKRNLGKLFLSKIKRIANGIR